MKNTESNKVNVFISYSWDSGEHQSWVISLADLIEENGANVIIDKKGLKFGGHIKTFMLTSILQADIVLMILTPNYKTKADKLEGGAGYEYNIINDELFKIILTNDKYIPVLRIGDLKTSVTAFLQGFTYVDLREGSDYNKNLKELLEQIFKVPLKQPIANKLNIPIMENEYKDVEALTVEMKSKARKYFEQLFLSKDTNENISRLKAELSSWEKEIEEYHTSLFEKFNPSKMEMYGEFLEDFKNNVFATALWTVSAALKTPDPDLARYKKDFREADKEEIYETVNGILEASHKYINSVVPSIEYKKVKNVEELHLEYLDEENMYMNKIIGTGIRSEILHRYYPSSFPMMTQRSLWAMYFICENANEFITIEQKNREGKMRVSHNWQYPYGRFAYLMNVLAHEFSEWLKEYDISLLPQYRFGYVNIFLSEIDDLHKKDIKLLHEWALTD